MIRRVLGRVADFLSHEPPVGTVLFQARSSRDVSQWQIGWDAAVGGQSHATLTFDSSDASAKCLVFSGDIVSRNVGKEEEAMEQRFGHRFLAGTTRRVARVGYATMVQIPHKDLAPLAGFVDDAIDYADSSHEGSSNRAVSHQDTSKQESSFEHSKTKQLEQSKAESFEQSSKTGSFEQSKKENQSIFESSSKSRGPGVELVLGPSDGRIYTFSIYCSAPLLPNPMLFQRAFKANKGLIRLPFAEFAHIIHGQQEDDSNLVVEPSRVRNVGIVLADGNSGPFKLSLVSIAAYR